MRISDKENGLEWSRIENNLSKLTNRNDNILKLNEVKYQDGNISNGFESDIPTDHAIKQMFSKLGMPRSYFKNLHDKGYYDLVKEHFDFNKDKLDKNIMLRKATYKDNDFERRVIRAVLSESYSPLNNDDLVQILKRILENTNYKITFYSNDWETMMLRIIFEDSRDKIEAEEGDVLQTGIVVVNSEVGTAGVLIAPTVLRLVCNNGLTAWSTIESDRFYRRHVGITKRKMVAFASDAIVAARKEGLERAKMLKETVGKELPDNKTKNEIIEDILKNKNINKSIIKQAQEVIEEDYKDRNDMYAVINSITRVARDLENTEQKLQVEKTVGDYVHNIAA